MEKTELEKLRDMYKNPERNVLIRSGADPEEIKTAIFSTEQPVEMVDWNEYRLINEILVAEGVRMESGTQLPMLDDHQRGSAAAVIGSGRNIQVEKVNGVSMVTGELHFSKSSEKARQIQALIDEGHLKDVSIGYTVSSFVDVEVGETKNVDGKKIFNNGLKINYNGHEYLADEALTVRVATDWRPREISTTPIGADSMAKIRSAIKNKIMPVEDLNQIRKEKNKMDPILEMTAAEKAEIITQTRQGEIERAAEIRAIAQKFSYVPEAIAKAETAIKEGQTPDKFRSLITDTINADMFKKQDIDTTAGEFSRNDIAAWSLRNILNAHALGKPELMAHERAMSEHLGAKLGVKARGVFMPMDVLTRRLDNVQQRALTVAGSGGSLVSTDLLATSYIEMLRNESVLLASGALTLTGLVGDVDIPRQTAGATFEHLTSEADTLTASDPTFDTLSLAPREGGAQTIIGRKMQKQTDPSIEMYVMKDLFEQIARGIDLNGIVGDGTGGAPTGILSTSGIGAVTGTTFAWPTAVEFETDILAANGKVGNMGFIAGAAVNGLLKTRVKVTGNPVYIIENGMLNGYPVKVTNQVPAATLIMGAFNSLILALWGALDLIVDPYSQAASGSLVLTAFQDYDWGVRYPAAFSATENIT